MLKKALSVMLAILMIVSALPLTGIGVTKAEAAVTSGLVANYDMTISNGKLVDLQGNYSATAVGFDSSDIMTGEDGVKYLNFNGDSGEYIELPSGLINSNTFTVEATAAVFKVTDHWLWTLGTKTGTWPNVNNYLFVNPLQAGGTIRAGIKDSSTEVLLPQTAAIKPNVYNKITMVFNNGTLTMYLNGAQVGSVSTGYSVTDIISNGTSGGIIGYIGRSLYTPDAPFCGKLADFKVWNRALSASEVAESYDGLAMALTEVYIPNPSDVRGNLTLISSTSNGATVSWSSSNSSVVRATANGSKPAGIVTRQSSDTAVTLTATVNYNGSTATKTFNLTVKKAPATSVENLSYSGYLFAFFTGTEGNADVEQMYFASSTDGFNWTDLNNDKPVMTSDTGDQGIRDPYIFRSAEGDKYYIIATDLSIYHRGGWGSWNNTRPSRSLAIWESTDLVNWTDFRLVEVIPENYRMAWAPEAIYDESTGEYIVYWSSYVDDFNDGKACVVYSKTRDFYHFTAPQPYIYGDDIIDTTIIKVGSKYFRASKYGGNSPGYIQIDSASSVLGTWTNHSTIQKLGIGLTEAMEGPEIYKLNGQNKWVVMMDRFATGSGYIPVTTTDLSSTNTSVWSTSNSYSYDSLKKRHGAVMNLTAEEYANIQNAYNGGNYVAGVSGLGGQYYIKNAHSGLYMDVVDGLADNNTNIQQHSFNGEPAQIFRLDEVSTGVYAIKTGASNFSSCVDIAGQSGDDGTNVQQYSYWGGACQHYKFVKESDGSYGILTGASNYGSALDMYNWSTSNGGNVNQWSYWGGACQRWFLEPVTTTTTTTTTKATTTTTKATTTTTKATTTTTAASSSSLAGIYYIQNVNSGLYMDVDGGSTANSANILQWAYNGNANQKFQLVATGETDVYYIKTGASGYSSCVDVAGASSADGTNVCQYAYNGNNNQKFKFVKQSDGSYAILTGASSYASGLDMYDWSTENGGNVNQWSYWGGACQRWNLIKTS